MKRFIFCILISLLVGVYEVRAQYFEPDTCKTVAFGTTFFRLDSLTIIPISVRTPLADVSLFWEKDSQRLRLEWYGEGAPPDSLEFCYTRLPYDLQKEDYIRSQAAYDSAWINRDLIAEGDYSLDMPVFEQEREQLFSYGNLQKSGSFSQGISAGNAQDVFVNSAINLQLEGEIAKDLELTMILSDQNVPFQPEGNTQQLQDFDRTLIRIKHPALSLTAGDIQFRQDNKSHFLRYFKNVRGVAFESSWGTAGNEKNKALSRIGVSAAKGQFHSYFLEVSEGVQGPYQITGPGNERFIIIQAGSENIFLDGRKLSRGFNNDYVINYNTAEITFNTNTVITQFSRVRVEFEFSVQHYNRSILQAAHKQQFGRLELRLEAYREADNRNQPTSFSLDNDLREALSEVGDNAQLAVTESVQPVESFSPDQILYTRADTVIFGELRSFFRRATAADEEFFNVTFTDVGVGQGEYLQSNEAINGRVFEFVGFGRGRFMPVRQIPLPNRREMIEAGLSFAINKNQYIFIDAAVSNEDKNLFSDLDSDDNQGQALRIGYRMNEQPTFLEGYKLNIFTDFEYNSLFFRPIDRFRSVEFERDWSLEERNIRAAQDQFFNIGTSLERDSRNRMSYALSRRVREDAIRGVQHRAEVIKSLGFLQTSVDFFLLDADKSDSRSDWVRIFADVHAKNKYLKPGYTFGLDQNSITRGDSVIASAMHFAEHKFYLHNSDSLSQNFKLEYTVREDKLPRDSRLETFVNTQALRAESQFQLFENQLITLNTTYRILDYGDSARSNNLMGRLDWRGTMLDEHIQTELVYNTATGTEPSREYVFIRVDNGQGTHTWRDDNGNGVQELNEFYEAVNPDERNYLKIFRPTGEYINAYSQDFITKLNIISPRAWRGQKSWRNWLSRLSGVFSWRSSRRVNNEDFNSRFNPFYNDIADDVLLGAQRALRSSLFFNRSNPQFGLEFSILESGQRNLLTNGFESRNRSNYQLLSRNTLGKNWALKLQVQDGNNASSSDFLDNRNFDIKERALRPELAWQPSTNLRVSLAYRYQSKKNQAQNNENEALTGNEISGELRWAKGSNRLINTKMRYVRFDFEGAANSPIGYEMLEALRPGTNFTWEANIQQRLGNGLRLTMTYQGRGAEDSPTIHTGSMQVTALF
ncbi:MAG: hypothetical protein JJT94_11190 [Bernardetiaceae bacterium]|nr:hypothetical protein [Bernardetiaceae bacterium]